MRRAPQGAVERAPIGDDGVGPCGLELAPEVGEGLGEGGELCGMGLIAGGGRLRRPPGGLDLVRLVRGDLGRERRQDSPMGLVASLQVVLRVAGSLGEGRLVRGDLGRQPQHGLALPLDLFLQGHRGLAMSLVAGLKAAFRVADGLGEGGVGARDPLPRVGLQPALLVLRGGELPVEALDGVPQLGLARVARLDLRRVRRLPLASRASRAWISAACAAWPLGLARVACLALRRVLRFPVPGSGARAPRARRRRSRACRAGSARR